MIILKIFDSFFSYIIPNNYIFIKINKCCFYTETLILTFYKVGLLFNAFHISITPSSLIKLL